MISSLDFQRKLRFLKSLASGNLFGKPKLASQQMVDLAIFLFNVAERNPMNQLSSIVLFTEYASYGTT